MKKELFKRYSFWISGISALFSLAAIIVSVWTSISSDNQFKYLNQGYIQINPYPSLDKDGQTLGTSLQLSDSEKIQGLNFHVELLNIGNLPLNYKFLKFDIYFNNTLYNQLTPQDRSDGVLYPKQGMTFNIQTTFFNPSRMPITYGELRQIDYRCHIVIEYYDFGSLHKKVIEREYKTEMFNGGSRTSYLRYNDSI